MAAFIWTGRVAFHETDAAGVVHFANFFRYAEEAEAAALYDLGLLKEPLAAGLYVPRVHVEADYARPLRFWDAYELHARVLKVGASSLHWSFALYVEGGLCATISWVSARIDGAGARVEYSEEERNLLMSLA